MTYIRNLSQADWFFKPEGAAATGTPAPAPTGTPAPAPASDEDKDEDEPAPAASVPVIEKRRTPIGFYILGGIGLLAVAYFLHKKFVSDEAEPEAESTELAAIEESEPAPQQKKHRRKK